MDFKLAEALLQIHPCFFSHSIKQRVLPLSAVTVSSLYHTRIVKLAFVQRECHTGKYSVIARIKSINRNQDADLQIF